MLAALLLVPTVAVLPFKDLAGGRAALGEAIRETVTVDLRDVPGLRVVERAAIDKVIAEQNWQAHITELDPISTIRLGTLLGAEFVVAGGYQRAGPTVRLTARFVKVATGEIVGTAKVDGDATEFLRLQDRVTVELLRSVGIAPAHVEVVAHRARPHLKSLRPIELYGDAAVEHDDARREKLLKEAVALEPAFEYAAHDLDALEKRMQAYAVLARVASDQQNRAIVEKIKGEKDPAMLRQYWVALLGQLMIQHRYRRMIEVARGLVANPPPPVGDIFAQVPETAQHWLVLGGEMTHDDDAILREGEIFMKRYPASAYFTDVQRRVGWAIDRKREAEEGLQKARDEIAKLDPEKQRDPCEYGHAYKANHRWPEARDAFEACLRAKPADDHAQYELIWVYEHFNDYGRVRKMIELLEREKSVHYPHVKDAAREFPVDD